MCKKNSKDLKETLLVILPVLLAALFILNFKIIRVDGQSMSPTLNDGQLILTSRHTDELERNSIVIVKYQDDLIVKRVAAMENDTVAMKDNSIFINGVKLANSSYEGEEQSFTLKKDEVFILGDNHKVSLDSRYFGTISTESIISVKI